MAVTIGIDLGTTNSRVGVFRNGEVEIILSDHDHRSTPSIVAFNRNKCLVGVNAQKEMVMNFKNTIVNFKRLLGQTLYFPNKGKHPKVSDDIQQFLYDVTPKKTLAASVKHKEETIDFVFEEITAMLLAELKKQAESHLGEIVENAVITVPAYFNDSQRQATKDAGEIAGFEVVYLLNEPTAAAIAYVDKEEKKKTTILVYDLGGGTLDVTILTIDDQEIEVQATSGNVHLGGIDFDEKLVDYCADEIWRKHKKNAKENLRDYCRLRLACEQSKKTLGSNNLSIDLRNFIDGGDYTINIDSSRFNSLCDSLFQDAFNPVEKTLKEANMEKNEIDEVLLVGGATRMPKIREMFTDFFGKQIKLNSSCTDEAVVCGAAIWAEVLDGDRSGKINNWKKKEVAPFRLGVKRRGYQLQKENVEILIDKNSRFQLKGSFGFKTCFSNKREIYFDICEEVANINNEENRCQCIGSLPAQFDNPRSKEITIMIEFQIDDNGILNVTAKPSTTKRLINEHKHWKRGLEPSEKKRMILDAKKRRDEEIMDLKRDNVKNNLQSLINDITKECGHDDYMRAKLQEIEAWLQENPMATINEYTDTHAELVKQQQGFHHKIGTAV